MRGITTLLLVALYFAVFASAERLQFMTTIMPSKQQCFLEAMQEKMNGRRSLCLLTLCV